LPVTGHLRAMPNLASVNSQHRPAARERGFYGARAMGSRPLHGRAPGTAMAVKTANLQPKLAQPFDSEQIASAQAAQKVHKPLILLDIT
jgi:hypothetical protein